MENNEKIWEKQPYETNLQYKYFHEYLMMSYEIKKNKLGNEIFTTSINSKRSLRGLAKKLKKNYVALGKISGKNEWVKRTEAFDLYMLNEIKSRREREYLEAQDRYSDMGKTIFDGIAKALQNIDWQKLKPCDMERLAKVAHAFELGEETNQKHNNNNSKDEDNAGNSIDSDSRERMKKIYEDSVKKTPVPKKIRKIRQLKSSEE